jgi:hypothetical protein
VPITHTYAPSYRTGSGSITLPSESIEGDQELNTEVSIPANSTNYEINIDFLQTAVLAVVIYCDQAATLKTNSTSTPQDTIALAAKKARIWRKGVDPDANNPFGGAVTTMYVTNATASIAGFKMYLLLDQVA